MSKMNLFLIMVIFVLFSQCLCINKMDLKGNSSIRMYLDKNLVKLNFRFSDFSEVSGKNYFLNLPLCPSDISP